MHRIVEGYQTMNLQKIRQEAKVLKYLSADDWMTLLVLVGTAIAVSVYLRKISERVVQTLGEAANGIIKEAEEVAKKAQEVEA